MRNMPMDSLTVLVVAGLSLVLPGQNCAVAQEGSSSKPNQQLADQDLQRTIVDVPFASIAGSELIGNTGDGDQRRWLVMNLQSQEPLPMHRAYTRFITPKAWNWSVRPWDNEISYSADPSGHDFFRRGFPKWRAHQGRLVFFIGWGFDPSPKVRLRSGFFVQPYRDDAVDYRIGFGPALREMEDDVLQEIAPVKERENGRLRVRRTVARFNRGTPIPDGLGRSEREQFTHLYDVGCGRELVDYFYGTPCVGCDFVLSSDREGLFFACPFPFERVGEMYRARVSEIVEQADLPAKMIVFDYSVRDANLPLPEPDEKRVNAPPQRRPSPRPDGPVVGLSAPGTVFRKSEVPVPDSFVIMEWIEKESFEVPFSVPFTAAVDGDDYYFITADGAIHRASPAGGGQAERSCQRIFHEPADPIIACIHESSTNRIFAFRKESYVPVDKKHLPQDGPPRFVSCKDITRPQRLTFIDENGNEREADTRFRTVWQAARVLREDGV